MSFLEKLVSGTLDTYVAAPSGSSLMNNGEVIDSGSGQPKSSTKKMYDQMKTIRKLIKEQQHRLITSVESDDLNSKIELDKITSTNRILQDTLRQVNKYLEILKHKQAMEDDKHNDPLSPSLYKTRKYSDNMNGFFPKHLVSKVRFDSELALSYLTPYNDAFEVASTLNELIKQQTGYYPNHIIDGTGGLGGNVIGFLRYFWSKRLHRKSVTMIELDEKRFSDARYNISLFEQDEKRHDKDCVTCRIEHGNFIDWWRREKQNFTTSRRNETLIFMDPPWGNQDYRLHDTIDDLYMMQENMSPISIKTFTRELLQQDGVQCVALKVPYNFSEASLSEIFDVQYVLMKKVKYLLVFCKSGK